MNITPFRLFITGGAGTGTSHLINIVFHSVLKLLSVEVKTLINHQYYLWHPQELMQ